MLRGMRRPSNSELRMRHWMGIALIAGCVPMAPASGGPGPAPGPAAQPAVVSSAPGDPAAPAPAYEPPIGPAAEAYDEPAEPLAAAEPAAAQARPTRPARGAQKPPSEPEAWINAHNRARARHCAAPLTWSAKLAQVAQHWANALRDKGCAFGHSNGSYGENLAAGTSGTLDPESVVKMWYDEVAQYRFPDGGFSMKTGHFTQVVWRGTKQVGCGASQCNGMDLWVCEYDPPGNWEGQYRQNVLPPGCK